MNKYTTTIQWPVFSVTSEHHIHLKEKKEKGGGNVLNVEEREKDENI